MADKIKEIPGKVLEWWKKYTTKQKALLTSIAAIVLLALGILTAVVTTPKMVPLKECENTKEAAQIKTLLDENKVNYNVTNDGLRFEVNEKDESTAVLLLGENNIPAATYELETVFAGGFSMTEADKTKKYQLYLEEKLQEQLKSIAAIAGAEVTLSIPNNDGTILAQEKESYASLVLDLAEELPEGTAEGLARFVATAIGNNTTDNILIVDSAGNLLFSGGDATDSAGIANSNLTVKSKAETMVKGQVTDVVLGTKLYDNVEIGLNLDMDFSETESTEREFSVPEGRENGVISSQSKFESQSEGGAAAVPGAEANDNNTYMMQDGTTSSSETTDETINYDNNEKVTNIKGGVGAFNYETSSMSVVANQYRVYDEKALRESGQLDGMTFDEFKSQNEAMVKVDVDEDMLAMVANATGIPQENITVMAYEVPFFKYDDSSAKGIMDYLPIILAGLIMLMLGFVVFRSTRKEAEPLLEPELSVEALLESTKEAQENLEDIGFSEKSETRVLIEKFVDENPEAAASLLRNWLNEEWE